MGREQRRGHRPRAPRWLLQKERRGLAGSIRWAPLHPSSSGLWARGAAPVGLVPALVTGREEHQRGGVGVGLGLVGLHLKGELPGHLLTI